MALHRCRSWAGLLVQSQSRARRSATRRSPTERASPDLDDPGPIDSVTGMVYGADDSRYDVQPYRRCGRSGLLLPAVSLGFWHNFGDDKPVETQRAVMRRAFDLGITHFDLANNYGPPYGAAEVNAGHILAQDFKPYRDELIISSKAGWDMWPGPYGDLGSRKYLTASLDQSLRRLGLDYVDIFYHHRPDPDTPLEETMAALDAAVRAGKALYVGVSSYSPQHTAQAAAILRNLGTPLLIHQPSYSMFNRWIEADLLDVLDTHGVGCIAFTALAQGLLTNRYLEGIPADSRAAQGKSLDPTVINEENLARVRALNEIAAGRGQSLAQLALAWVLRDQRVTSTLIGASSVAQLEDNVAATSNLSFSDDELAAIYEHAVESGVDLWARAREAV
jgi:L-glyceraldehyde 3-phosphate reductase